MSVNDITHRCILFLFLSSKGAINFHNINYIKDDFEINNAILIYQKHMKIINVISQKRHYIRKILRILYKHLWAESITCN